MFTITLYCLVLFILRLLTIKYQIRKLGYYEIIDFYSDHPEGRPDGEPTKKSKEELTFKSILGMLIISFLVIPYTFLHIYYMIRIIIKYSDNKDNWLNKKIQKVLFGKG